MNTVMPGRGQERRRFFRIDDEVYLEYRQLPEEDYQQRLQQPAGSRQDTSALALQLHGLTSQSSSILAQIRKRDPEVGQYLAIIDRKVELLSRALLGSQLGHISGPNHKVNLSGSGIAFYRTEPLPPESKLELRLMLFPGHTVINALGRVVHCTETGHTTPLPYRIGVEFTQLAEVARDALVRHTLELQSARLRQQKEQRKDTS
ncbi:PilZ domain-containing protein [Sulfurivermis fontis]|uniref:PilZ domain-containing protein n=1 Tax=Sulfurivermis fontis TaxID=1972068 RepID=UPI000FDB2618|nr:PilZ domain-containing protein [Sulfurivermis fontis]